MIATWMAALVPKAPPKYRPPGWAQRKPYANSRTRDLRVSGRRLQAINERIKLRDMYQCQLCGCITDVGQVDHIKPLAQGGHDVDNNKQWLCVPCHDRKTNSERSKWNLK